MEEKLTEVLWIPKEQEKAMMENTASMPLGMAYVPMQKWGKTYEPDVALDRGTIFPDLDLPFTGAKTD